MDLHVTPETEAKLNELARRTRRGADELLAKAVDPLVSYNEWFERKVRDSQAAVGRGEPFLTGTSARGSTLGNAGSLRCESNGRQLPSGPNAEGNKGASQSGRTRQGPAERRRECGADSGAERPVMN